MRFDNEQSMLLMDSDMIRNVDTDQIDEDKAGVLGLSNTESFHFGSGLEFDRLGGLANTEKKSKKKSSNLRSTDFFIDSTDKMSRSSLISKNPSKKAPTTLQIKKQNQTLDFSGGRSAESSILTMGIQKGSNNKDKIKKYHKLLKKENTR